jgi:hypothetical protein
MADSLAYELLTTVRACLAFVAAFLAGLGILAGHSRGVDVGRSRLGCCSVACTAVSQALRPCRSFRMSAATVQATLHSVPPRSLP